MIAHAGHAPHTGLKTKGEAVELGLRTLLRLRRQAQIRKAAWQAAMASDLDAMRRDRGSVAAQAEKLDHLLASEPLAIGDLILTEVLQRFTDERGFKQAKNALTALTVVELCGQDVAIQAARNFRLLRRLGITVRKTIDTVIATRCIESGYLLLHSDRDFDPFAEHLGLRVVT